MRRRITLTAAGTALLAVLLLALPLAVFAARGYVTDERLELQRAAGHGSRLGTRRRVERARAAHRPQRD